MLNAAMIFPWRWALASIVACSDIGFDLNPAWKAATLEPIEALLHE